MESMLKVVSGLFGFSWIGVRETKLGGRDYNVQRRNWVYEEQDAEDGATRQEEKEKRGVETEIIWTCAEEICWAYQEQDAEDGAAKH